MNYAIKESKTFAEIFSEEFSEYKASGECLPVINEFPAIKVSLEIEMPGYLYNLKKVECTEESKENKSASEKADDYFSRKVKSAIEDLAIKLCHDIDNFNRY